MKFASRILKAVLQKTASLELESFGPRTYALIDTRRRADAWFSFRNQLQMLLASQAIDLVIDVGANEGQFARSLRRIYRGPIHSFEPVSAVHQKLSQAAAVDPSWTTYRMALGSQNSTQTIRVAERTEFSSFLKANDYSAERFGGRAQGVREEVVEVRRLDEFLESVIPDIDDKRIFLKLDTQGYDLEVFSGLGERVSQVEMLVSEISLLPIYESMPHWTDAIRTYEHAGLKVAGMFPVSRDGTQVIEYDCLMVRAPKRAP